LSYTSSTGDTSLKSSLLQLLLSYTSTHICWKACKTQTRDSKTFWPMLHEQSVLSSNRSMKKFPTQGRSG